MKRSIKTLLATLVVSLSLAAPGLAGPLEDADAAYKRGDHATALRLLRPLAELGDASAQFNLGVMYKIGEGVPQDYVEAHKWLNIAGTKKSGPVSELRRKARDKLARKMTPAQIAEAQRLAREWKPKK